MNWNVKDVDAGDIDFLNDLKSEKKIPSNQVLHLLIKHYNSVTQASTKGNPELEAKLQEVTQQLQKVTHEGHEAVTLHQQALQEAEAKINELQEQIQNLQQNPTIPPPAFIFTPTEKINLAMDAVQEAFYKKGFTKNTNPDAYRNEITKYALRYLIENEFAKYLKA